MKKTVPDQIKLEIDLEYTGQRLDTYLTDLLNNLSRSRIQKLIDDSEVLVNNKPVKKSYKLRYGDNIDVNIPEDKPVEILPENIPLEIIYEDEYLAVVNKPSGMLTHPAPGKYTGTLVNAILYHCKDSLSGINGYLRPGIVHRLDKDTTGLILIAKNDFAHKHLATEIQERQIEKYYLAIVQSNIKDDTGTINAPIGRHPVKREKMAIIEDGREAITHWKVLERFKIACFVEARLITGRTHQLRVHFSHIKHPIMGDPLYGNVRYQNIKLDRQMLQAYKISFTHPKTCEKVSFKVDFDQDLRKVLKIFNSEYLSGEKQL
ncbi:MAG: RluA family pseudouridine synthase [Cyanobacteriota bacterium]